MNFNIDLKNIDLKNISLEDIQAKLKKVEKKTWIKLGSSLGAIIVFLIIFYGVLNPIVNKKKAQLMDMNTKIEETEQFNNKIIISKKKIKKLSLSMSNILPYSILEQRWRVCIKLLVNLLAIII